MESSLTPEFIITRRGGKKLVHLNFLYKINRECKGVGYYRCDNKNCAGPTILISKDKIVATKNMECHNHSDRRQDIAQLKLMETMKKRAASERLTMVTSIYREETNRVAVAALPLAPPERPPFQSIKMQLYRARKSSLPPIPKGVDNIKLEGSWGKTLRGESFLQSNIGDGSEKILIFSTKENLKKLGNCPTVYMDGTFSALPMEFTQLYTLHGNYMGQVFPLVYALLQDKKKTTYVRMLREIEAEAASFDYHFHPERFFTDFESSVFAAVEEVFPRAEKKGCLFHYSQCIWRKVQEMGLVVQYREDEEIKKWVQRLIALPLVPAQHVDDAFLLLQDEAPVTAQTVAMHDYVVDTWVDDAALFHCDIWNHFATVGARTNNHVEGWHSKIGGILNGRRHQNIFEYVGMLQRLQQEAEMGAADLERGALPPQTPLVYRNMNIKLASLKERLNNGDLTFIQYFDAAKHVLHHNV